MGGSVTGGSKNRTAAKLSATADDVERWLAGPGVAAVDDAAQRIAGRRAVAVVGAGYGVPIAHELALKIKEASYVHAEGFRGGRVPPRELGDARRDERDPRYRR